MEHKSTLIQNAINWALKEDIGDGDHSSLSCVPSTAINKAVLLAKEDGVLAGVEIAKQVFETYGEFKIECFKEDGDIIKNGEEILLVTGSAQGILACERLVLNIIQRMSGIATYTKYLVNKIGHTSTQLLDTRKTTPNFRVFEKEAVRIGGGVNHRFALYDMIMLKDNHIDYAGGIAPALKKANDYIKTLKKPLKIEIEVRDFEELNEALEFGDFDRVMLDNFSPVDLSKALKKINKQFETEASGGITEDTIVEYAETGVDYISVGALTHQVKSLDLSLKAVKE